MIHAWFVLSKPQNSLLLLETPADLATTIDTPFIARQEELHKASSRTVPIVTIHSVIFLLFMCCCTDSQAVLTSADGQYIYGCGIKRVVQATKWSLSSSYPPLKNEKLQQLSLQAGCAEGADLCSHVHPVSWMARVQPEFCVILIQFSLPISHF